MTQRSLSTEMLEWEVHALRNVVTVVTTEVVLAARQQPDNPTLRDLAVLAKMQRRRLVVSARQALRSSEYRRRQVVGTTDLYQEVPTP